MQEPINPLLRGEEGALKRALYKFMGYDDEALARPLVAVVNTFTTATPGHFTLDEFSRQAAGHRIGRRHGDELWHHRPVRRHRRGARGHALHFAQP